VFFAFLIYSWAVKEIRVALSWPNRKTFKRTKEYLQLAVPAALLLEADFVSWNIVQFASSYIGDGYTELAASICWF